MKQYTNMVRVMDSTYQPTEIKKALIGKELEVKEIWFDDKTLRVYNEDKSDYWYFNLTDVRFLTPLSFKGNRVAIGDMVKWNTAWREVVGFFLYDAEYRIVVECKQRGTTTLTESEIEDHDFNQTKETITIGGKVYDKHEFEECVKNLKEIK